MTEMRDLRTLVLPCGVTHSADLYSLLLLLLGVAVLDTSCRWVPASAPSRPARGLLSAPGFALLSAVAMGLLRAALAAAVILDEDAGLLLHLVGERLLGTGACT